MNNLFQLEEIDKKIEALREEYKNAPPERRPVIEAKARPWKTAKVMAELGKL